MFFTKDKDNYIISKPINRNFVFSVKPYNISLNKPLNTNIKNITNKKLEEKQNENFFKDQNIEIIKNMELKLFEQNNNACDENNIENFIKNKCKEKTLYNYDPNKHSKKVIVLFACHCDSKRKLFAINNNLKYFVSETFYKVIINSKNLPYNDNLKKICKKKRNTTYFEIENTEYCDFGKCVYAIENLVNVSYFDFVLFTNDSIIIHDSINHFFNLGFKQNVQLYGYNDSTQLRFHYQSYLFLLRKDAINTFLKEVNNKNIKITCLDDVVHNFEVKMTDWFKTHDCFLKIGNIESHKFLNIYFSNDSLYFLLKESGLLPFSKIKRIQLDEQEETFEF
jgi:hypothetical protein